MAGRVEQVVVVMSGPPGSVNPKRIFDKVIAAIARGQNLTETGGGSEHYMTPSTWHVCVSGMERRETCPWCAASLWSGEPHDEGCYAARLEKQFSETEDGWSTI